MTFTATVARLIQYNSDLLHDGVVGMIDNCAPHCNLSGNRLIRGCWELGFIGGAGFVTNLELQVSVDWCSFGSPAGRQALKLRLDGSLEC